MVWGVQLFGVLGRRACGLFDHIELNAPVFGAVLCGGVGDEWFVHPVTLVGETFCVDFAARDDKLEDRLCPFFRGRVRQLTAAGRQLGAQ